LLYSIRYTDILIGNPLKNSKKGRRKNAKKNESVIESYSLVEELRTKRISTTQDL